MGTAWVAGGVRGSSLLRRRLGRAEARAVAARPSLELAIDQLVRSPYVHDVRVGQSLAEAQRSVSATALWHVRVLAGWLPREGAEVVRTLAGAWEIANVSLVLASIRGAAPVTPYELGALATIPRRYLSASTPREIRRSLVASTWGDPFTDEPAELLGWMRLRWGERVAASVPGASSWAAGYLALMVARALFVDGRRPDRRGWPVSPLGIGWENASSIPDLARRLPPRARWTLAEVEDGSELWSAEARWWSAIERMALERQHWIRPGSAQGVVASVVVLAADAWRTRAALEVASRGGQELEAFDALG
ncbi:MAG: hypothetical protein ACXW4H_00350 [Candidatus Limnocylindrales bacterium]